MSQNRKSPVIWVADKVVLQLKVETPQACKLVMLNKAGVIAVVDLFKQYHPEGVHRKDVRVKNFVRRMHVSEFGNEADMHIALRAIQSHVLADAQERECARRMSNCLAAAFKQLLSVLPEDNQAFPDAAMAKAYTREKVRDLKALTKLRARHAEESDEDYEAALRAWLYGKLRCKLQGFGTYKAA